jgi:hypothetical protein
VRPARDDYQGRWANQLQALQFQLAFIFGFRPEVEQRAGGNGSWNVGVDYGRLLARSPSRDLVGALYHGLDLRHDLRLLAKGRRVRPDLRSTAYLVRNIVFDGRIAVPVLTVHTTHDGLVVSPHEEAYRNAVRRAGRVRLLEQLWVDRPGHCTFTDAETLAALDVLLKRLDRGRWPKDTGTSFADYEPPPFLRPFDLGAVSFGLPFASPLRSVGARPPSRARG